MQIMEGDLVRTIRPATRHIATITRRNPAADLDAAQEINYLAAQRDCRNWLRRLRGLHGICQGRAAGAQGHAGAVRAVSARWVALDKVTDAFRLDWFALALALLRGGHTRPTTPCRRAVPLHAAPGRTPQ
jgi:hypothetical protein